MNSKSLWNDQIPEKDGIKTPVNDIAISPDGTKVIAAVGNRVLLYKADNGDLIESLRGHKDVVYSVSFSSDGSRFSSGKLPLSFSLLDGVLTDTTILAKVVRIMWWLFGRAAVRDCSSTTTVHPSNALCTTPR
jgi:WD40 repeat protein